MAVTFQVGEKFSNLADLEKKIVDYQRTNYISLHKRDSRTIDAALKRKSISADREPSNEVKENLKYYAIQYACIHGGRKYISKGAGMRNTATFKHNCPFNLLVRLSEDGMYLSVRALNTEHSHIASEETYKCYPSVRRLTDDQRSYAEKQLEKNVDKKQLQHQLESLTGKSVSLKYLHNIMASAKRRRGEDKFVKGCCDVHVKVEESDAHPHYNTMYTTSHTSFKPQLPPPTKLPKLTKKEMLIELTAGQRSKDVNEDYYLLHIKQTWEEDFDVLEKCFGLPCLVQHRARNGRKVRLLKKEHKSRK